MTGYSSKSGGAERDELGGRSLHGVCDLLADQRRQYALAYLIDQTQDVTLTELAEDVAVREKERPLAEIPREIVRTISLSLHHAHIPKLEDGGAVEYNSDRNLVQISEPTDLIERVLSLGAVGGEHR